VIFRLLWVACVFALRFFAQPAPLVPSADAPPPAAEDRLAVADGTSDADSDDPSDVDDDDDDDDDDVALPAAIFPAAPRVTVAEATWSILTLTDKNGCDRLFRPPRLA
jgi:hypothetical protein